MRRANSDNAFVPWVGEGILSLRAKLLLGKFFEMFRGT